MQTFKWLLGADTIRDARTWTEIQAEFVQALYQAPLYGVSLGNKIWSHRVERVCWVVSWLRSLNFLSSVLWIHFIPSLCCSFSVFFLWCNMFCFLFRWEGYWLCETLIIKLIHAHFISSYSGILLKFVFFLIRITCSSIVICQRDFLKYSGKLSNIWCYKSS